MSHLDTILTDVWRHLAAGIERPDHPFRTPVLCTRGVAGPNARILVLRAVDEQAGELVCFSDTRADKWSEIGRCPSVVWVFYDPRARVQLRAYGEAHRLTDGDRVDAFWGGQSGTARNNYRTRRGPGERLSEPDDGIPAAVRDRLTDVGREHFGVLVTRLTRLDWLDLSGERYRRALFERDRDRWCGTWSTP